MFKNSEEYHEEKFVDLDLSNRSIENVKFEYCFFTCCKFDSTTFKKCKFVDCTFKSTSMNLTNFDGSTFTETEFNQCNMKGINWTKMSFPYIVLGSPIHFTDCEISYSSFYELNLSSITLINCKAHEVDFRGTNLSNSDLSGTDFLNAQFCSTNLSHSDIRKSINYNISPTENNIRKAKFSLLEVIGLLNFCEIEIDSE